MPDLLKCIYYGVESYSSNRYFYDNKTRGDGSDGVFVIQRTIRGAAFYRDRREHVRVGPGQAMLFCHGEDSCYGYPEDATEPYELEFLAMTGERSLFDAVRQKAGSRVALAAHSESLAAFQALAFHVREHRFRDRFHESLCGYELLIALLRQAWTGDLLHDPVAAAREYIKNHYSEPLTQQEVAAHVGLSREHLTRSFRQRFGTTPARLCEDLRMGKARELLSLQFRSVSQIAANCGYTDANSFARAFRRRNGVSPQQFQQFAMPGHRPTPSDPTLRSR
ncbi:helix-turn-helix transcriptional regulator [Ruficoccus amylovorans]|uniref:Helix-turn-helix transcriptional regulator n=1 Tax=Ruficoccus amylovorans TaxID=1804625 RepID=A0A842HIS9_9BACT|nr:AraC family transcriptional regulator [Ruficoccus amylovorans]MBC2595101.1 helix-turn-helix transcriptional regulator [Ruficoccus amylovorans]